MQENSLIFLTFIFVERETAKVSLSVLQANDLYTLANKSYRIRDPKWLRKNLESSHELRLILLQTDSRR
jgi:hypothetical protein